MSIVNCLSRFRAGIESLVRESGLSGDGADAIAEALGEVDRQVHNGINPLLSSIEDAVEAIVLTVHKEDFSAGAGDQVPDEREGAGDGVGANTSPYMKELQSFVARVSTDYLQVTQSPGWC